MARIPHLATQRIQYVPGVVEVAAATGIGGRMVAHRARAAPTPPTHDTTQPQWSPKAQHCSFVEWLQVCCALGCWQSQCERLCQTLALCWSPASAEAGQGAEVYSVCMCEQIHTYRNTHAVRLGGGMRHCSQPPVYISR